MKIEIENLIRILSFLSHLLDYLFVKILVKVEMNFIENIYLPGFLMSCQELLRVAV